MKKILLILGLALMLISCEKHEAGDKFILFSPEELVFDKQSGGTMSITTSDKALVELIIGKKKNLEGAADSWEFKSFFEVNPPRYTIALEDIKKLPEETEEQFLWKIGQMVDSGKIENWASINDIVNKELGIDEDKWRDESSFRKRYQAAKKFYDGCFSKMECEEHQKKLDAINRELARNTIKFRDQRNAWQRQNYADSRVEETLDIF